MNIFKVLIATVLVLSTNGYVHADNWPTIVNPPEADVVWVGDDINQNGLLMKIKNFKTKLSIDDVIDFYRIEWHSDSKEKPVENDLGPWKVIGKQVGEYYLTVQVKSSNNDNSEGFMGVSKLPVYAGNNENLDFPYLDGTTVESNTSTNDIGKSGQTFVLQNDYSIQSNVSFYESELPARGWAITHRDKQTVSGGMANFFYLQKNKRVISMIIHQNNLNKTVIVVNKIKY